MLCASTPLCHRPHYVTTCVHQTEKSSLYPHRHHATCEDETNHHKSSSLLILILILHPKFPSTADMWHVAHHKNLEHYDPSSHNQTNPAPNAPHILMYVNPLNLPQLHNTTPKPKPKLAPTLSPPPSLENPACGNWREQHKT